MDENQLIQRLKDGNTHALTEVMEQYQNYAYSILKGMLQADEAAEATQDSFIKVFRSIDKFNGQSKFSTWLYAICYRTGLDYLKKRKPTVSLDNESMPAHFLAQNEVASALLEKEDLTKLLDQAISQMKPQDATILRMFYWKELNLKEIVEITGLSESNIKVRLYRCRKQLKEILESQKQYAVHQYLNIKKR